jgi:hypothetical protein
VTVSTKPKAPRFTDKQRTAVDYIVLCASNQGNAHANGKNAAQAVAITLRENRQLNAHQLQTDTGRPMRVGVRMVREATRQVSAIWNAE